jgi:hypothetical protein
MKFFNKFGFLIDFLSLLSLLFTFFLYFLLAVFLKLSLEYLHLCFEFIKQLLKVIVSDFKITAWNNLVHIIALILSAAA